MLKLITLLVLLFTPYVAQGATYYVSTTGLDSNPGTQALPFRTINKATDVARTPGDTIFVRGGTYSEWAVMHYPGAPGAPITLQNFPGETPVIQNGVGIWNALGSNLPIGYLTIQGFEITNSSSTINSGSGIGYGNADNFVIRNNYIHDAQGQGILGNGFHVTIEGNRVVHNGQFAKCQTDPPACNQDHGMYLTGTFYTIINNIVYDNLGYGIQVAAYPPGTGNQYSADYSDARNFLIANNTIAYEANRSAMILWQGGASDNTIVNNIMYENGQVLVSGNVQGLEFSNAGNNNVVNNNLFYATTPGATVAIFDSRGGASYTASNNLTTSQPGFVNAPPAISGTPDFYLQSSSPAINAGTTVGAVTTDFAGITRPQGGVYDIGAYEFVSGGGAAPTNLRVLR